MNINELFIDGSKLLQPLTKEEIHKLMQEANKGSEEAREKLIKHNLRLVLYEVTNRFKNVNYDKKDLVSIGIIGLLKAINTYDLTRGVGFASYAMRCIDNEILMFLRKLKKEQCVVSFDSLVFNNNKDDNQIKLEDTIGFDYDFIEECEMKEEQETIRELVSQLPDRDREIIMLYFGFYDDKIYTQSEISNKFNISRSYVSRLVTKAINKLREQLLETGVIQNDKEKYKINEKMENDEMPKLQTIYEYFKDYTREQVDEILTKLSEEDRGLVILRYGLDLDNPVSSKLSKEELNRFYGSLIPKMKRLLKNLGNEGKKRGRKPKTENGKCEPKTNRQSSKEEQKKTEVVEEPKPIIIDTDVREKSDDELDEISSVTKNDTKDTIITKEDAVKMLELLRTPSFSHMMTVLTVKEATIISLKLGYIDGKCFSTESIAGFLGIEEEEVREATKKILLLYKESINNFLDNIIAVATDRKGYEKVLSIK